MMKLINSIALTLAIVSAIDAHAADYECIAKKNPDRGFSFDFNILVESASVGGDIVLVADGRGKIIGSISKIGSLKRSDGQAFDLTLGHISEEDVSGIAESDLNRVSTIEILQANTADDDEVLVYKLLEGTTQIGGTVLISGMGTACLPK